MSTSPHIAFIGGGNIAQALIGGLIANGWAAENLRVAEPQAAQRDALATRFGVAVFADNSACLATGDVPEVVVLAVKPQVMQAALASIGAAALPKPKPLILSVAAGVDCARISRWLGAQLPLVRAMPNTPALVNAGVAGLFANPQVTPRLRRLAEDILGAVGEVVWVESEALINTITAISGSGPAYFFKLMELMVASAVQHGLPQKTAEAISVQTALGAALLAKRSAQSPESLRQQVTSPGGTTEAALEAMHQLGLDASVRQGIAAALKRAQQLNA